MTDALLQVENISVEYHRGRHRSRAVTDVSFTVGAGETVGLVGESGSGKSTIAKAILGLAPVSAGRIIFAGEDITKATARRRRALTKSLQVVYQDPYGSLNSVRTIGATLIEPLQVHFPQLSALEQRARVREALASVGLPETAAERYPADFSGGQRQRIAISRALIVQPQLIVCDEAVSGLDLSIQAQVLNLLEDFRRDLGIAYVFITHDLTVVRHIASRLVVLHGGQVVEQGDVDAIATNPAHAYTAMLLAAAPVPNPEEQKLRRVVFRRMQTDWTAALLAATEKENL